jgi:hypothetical protein
MKKLNYLLMGLFVASAFTFTSCSSDDEAASADIYYSVNGGSKQVAGAVIEEAVGSNIDLEATFSMGTNKLSQIVVEMLYDGSTYTLQDTLLGQGVLNSADKTFTFKYSTTVSEKQKVVYLTAIDTKDIDTTFIVTIKPTAASIATGKIKTSSAKILGAQQNSAYGSLYSVYLDQVIKLADGKNIQSSIDLVYYYNATNKTTLAAPSSASAVYAKSIALWNTQNATKIAKVTVADFAAIETEVAFDAAYGATVPTSTEATDLKVNDVLAVKTVGGQKALVKVTAISAASEASYITVLVKTVVK